MNFSQKDAKMKYFFDISDAFFCDLNIFSWEFLPQKNPFFVPQKTSFF